MIMVDRLSKEMRSKIMSSIRSKWTKNEVAIHSLLKSRKIRHKMHPKIEGNPDIILKDQKVAIFIDGCFWHGCGRCYQEPQSNRDYWIPKIMRRKEKDKSNSRILRENGYKVIRIWEHSWKHKRTTKWWRTRLLNILAQDIITE